MKYVSINSHTIRRNKKHGENNPPIRIARTPSDKKPVYAFEAEIVGPAKLIYNPKAPILKCGARLVLQCEKVNILK